MNVLQLIPEKLAAWMMQSFREGFNGSITLHFNHGKIAMWEIRQTDRP